MYRPYVKLIWIKGSMIEHITDQNKTWERVIPLILTVTDTLCNLQHENEKTFEVVEEKNCVVWRKHFFLNMHKDNNKGLDQMKPKNEPKLKKKPWEYDS